MSDCTDVPISEWRIGPNSNDNGVIAEGHYTTAVGEYFSIPTRYGDVCQPGSFCTGGVRADCVAGTVCELEGMSTNTVDCDAGYYCEAGTTRKRPNDLSLYQ